MSLVALPWLWNARITRIDGPQRDCLALSLYDRGEKYVLVLMFGAAVRGIGAVRERPKGDPASAFIQRLRTQLENARLIEAHWLQSVGSDETRAQALLLTCERNSQRARIAIDFDARTPNLFLLRDDNIVAGASDERTRRVRFPKGTPYAPGAGRGIERIESAQALFAAGARLFETRADQQEDRAREQAKSQLRARRKKLQRKLEAIRADLARAEEAPRLRREGQLLLANLANVPRGASEARLLDLSIDPPEWLELKLDPALGAQQLAQQRFDRARRAERGVSIASARLREAEAEARELDALLSKLDTEPEAALGEIASTQPQLAPKKNKATTRVPYREFASMSGQRILVGKGAADNDTLTLLVARPHDHWMHVRGVAGSHVVVPLEKKATIAQELLLDAAHLAAHFSKQRGEPVVEVAHTERRFVRKPKGAAPGSVNLDRERVLVLRVERERLQRLLANERNP